MIGVSASTVDIEKKDVYQKLDEFFNLKPVNVTFRDAVNMGVLSPVYLATLQFQMYKEARALHRRIKNLGDDAANKEVSEFLMDKVGFSYTACHVFLEYMKMGNVSEQGLVFTSSIEHAEQLSTLLSHIKGTPVPAYHTQSKDPKQIIQDFKSGKFPILVTVGKVDEGFDHPLIKFILDFRVYKHSVRRLKQSVGRGTRLLEGGSPCFVLSLQIFNHGEQILPRTYYEESVILGPGNTNKSLRDLVDPTLPGDITDEKLLQKIFGKDDVKSIRPFAARLLNPSAKGDGAKYSVKLGQPPEDDISQPHQVGTSSGAGAMGGAASGAGNQTGTMGASTAPSLMDLIGRANMDLYESSGYGLGSDGGVGVAASVQDDPFSEAGTAFSSVQSPPSDAMITSDDGLLGGFVGGGAAGSLDGADDFKWGDASDGLDPDNLFGNF